MHPLNVLRHHVTGAIERGEAYPIAGWSLRCDWDSNVPEAIWDNSLGRVIGTLMPVDHALVARSPGIQPWSKGR